MLCGYKHHMSHKSSPLLRGPTTTTQLLYWIYEEACTYYICKLKDSLVVKHAAHATSLYRVHVVGCPAHHQVTTHQAAITYCYCAFVPTYPKPPEI